MDKSIRYVTIDEINKEIKSKFTSAYKNCTKKYEEMDEVAVMCNCIIDNPYYLNFIILSNDISKIPPTKTILKILQHEGVVKDDFQFSPHDSQYIGSLMGFIFKNIFKYKSQEDRIRVKLLGVGTASRFSECANNIIIDINNPS